MNLQREKTETNKPTVSTSDVPCATAAARAGNYSPHPVDEPDAQTEHRRQPDREHFLLPKMNILELYSEI